MSNTEAFGEQPNMTAEQLYLLMHGTFPPEVGSDETLEELEKRIEEHESLASRSKDTEESERLIYEASYLRDKSESLRRAAKTAIKGTVQ